MASFVAALAVTSVMPPSEGPADQVAHLVVLILVSTATLVLLDRATRRLLPLATLLDLSLLFPESAPSRLMVARDSIRRRPIEAQLTRVRRAGVDPSTAATAILSLVAAMSTHDRATRGHAERVRMFTELIATEMRVPERDRELLRWAAILHDIGKLRVAPSLLNKPGKPTLAEWVALKAHPANGADIASGLLPWLGEWGQVIIQHHEKWDGTGYPRGLAGQQIHVGARIVAVADAYDVMTSLRPYRRPLSRVAAYNELVRFAGTQFDPVAVRAMVSVSAPPVRHTQRMIAWLANVPIVATHVVPATLARVITTGALATGAVTGVGLAAPAAQDQPPVQAEEATEVRTRAVPPKPSKVAQATKTKKPKVNKAKKKKVKTSGTATKQPAAGKTGKPAKKARPAKIAEPEPDVVEESPAAELDEAPVEEPASAETPASDSGSDTTAAP